VPADGTVRFAKYDFLLFLFNDNLMRSLHHFWDYCCRSSELHIFDYPTHVPVYI